MCRPAVMALVTALALAGCGGAQPSTAGAPHAHPLAGARQARLAAQASHAPGAAPQPKRRTRQAPLVALVTAQTEDRVLAVALPSGRILRSVTVPGSPGYVAAAGPGGPYVVVSSAGSVSLLGGPRLHREAVLTGFGSPHIPAIAPGGGWAYVTDDGRGQLVSIGLTDRRVDSRTFVGAGAHHLAFSPDGRQVWVALGQVAPTIVILSLVSSQPPAPASPVVDPARPHVVGRLRPPFLAHDLLFTPDGREVWITAARGDEVGVFDARSHRLRFRVAAGPPPQHIAFAGGSAYITSGYGSLIERVSVATGRITKRAPAPYGSFDLDAAGRYVVTASLLRGTLAIYDRSLHLLRIRRVAPSAEDVALATL